MATDFIACDHEATPQNTIMVRPKGSAPYRTCRTCRNAKQRARYNKIRIAYEARKALP